MASFSKVILMGNVTRDPEIRAFPSGSRFVNFSVGINRKYKGSDGNLVDEPTFVDIKIYFEKQVEVCEKYVHKGDSIVVEGRLKQDSWEKDGQKKSKLVVIGEKLHLMPKKAEKADDTTEGVSDESLNGYEPVEPLKKKKDEEVPF